MTLENLSYDIIRKIMLENLHLDDVLRLKAVSKYFGKVCTDKFWSFYVFTKFNIKNKSNCTYQSYAIHLRRVIPALDPKIKVHVKKIIQKELGWLEGDIPDDSDLCLALKSKLGPNYTKFFSDDLKEFEKCCRLFDRTQLYFYILSCYLLSGIKDLVTKSLWCFDNIEFDEFCSSVYWRPILNMIKNYPENHPAVFCWIIYKYGNDLGIDGPDDFVEIQIVNGPRINRFISFMCNSSSHTIRKSDRWVIEQPLHDYYSNQFFFDCLGYMNGDYDRNMEEKYNQTLEDLILKLFPEFRVIHKRLTGHSYNPRDRFLV